MTDTDLFQELVKILERGESAALATIIGGKGSTPRKIGAKMLIRRDGTSYGTIGGGIVEARVIQKAIECLKSRRSEILAFDLNAIKDPDSDLRCGGNMMVMLDSIIPQEPVIICGGGHVGFAIYSILSLLDFKITVVDDRRRYASPKRFPKAMRVICSPYTRAFEKMNVDENTYIVICTRGHKNDEECLRLALSSPSCYVGMLGSKTKAAGMKKKMRELGIPSRRIRELHAPIGIPIGAQSPEEIAVSIAAELIQFRVTRTLQAF